MGGGKWEGFQYAWYTSGTRIDFSWNWGKSKEQRTYPKRKGNSYGQEGTGTVKVRRGECRFGFWEGKCHLWTRVLEYKVGV